MAVRHGYGKVATEGLVFAYDTGDTVNSYKGEPTTNINPNGVAVGHNSGNYGNVVTVVDAPEKGPGWKKVTINNRGSNFRIIQWTYTSMVANTMYCHSAVFDWGNMRGKGYSIVFDGTGTGTRAYYRPGDYTNTGSGTINSSMPDGKFMATITHTASHNHAFFIRNNTTGVSGLNDYFYYKEFQVEVNSHPTPYTTGTRSVSGSLLDLTGLGGINLSNVSFDSNAQMTFDGTDDRIELGDTFDLAEHFVDNQSFTIEVVVNILSSTAAGNGYAGIFTNQKYQTESDPGGFGLAISTSGGLHFRLMMTDSTPTSYQGNAIMSINVGQMEHITYTYDSAADTVTAYRNGESTSTTVSSTIQWSVPTDSTRTAIGRNTQGGWGNYYNSDLPVVKCYNRALTADEIRNNYRHYKNRFNI